MVITLTGEEREFLLDLLKRYLGDLRVEIARTDNRKFKESLRYNEKIAEELVEKVASA